MCLKEYWLTNGKPILTTNPAFSPYYKQCASVWKSKKSMAICLRSFAAISSIKDYFQEVHKVELSLEHPSQKISSFIINWTYPSPQCRLDTMIAGALCDGVRTLEKVPGISQQGAASTTYDDATTNACIEGPGKRPPCWFKAP